MERPAWIRQLSLAVGLAMLPGLRIAAAGENAAAQFVEGPLSVMVLGSGGPVATPKGRASAGYLIFTDGEPRILMDAGGGTYQRLAASGVNIKDLDLVLLSHLHIDHTSDLSAMIKTLYFHNRGAGTRREAPIRIYGPGGNGKTFPGSDVPQYPATTAYVDGHYSMPGGVQRYLHVFAGAIRGGSFDYSTRNIDPALGEPVRTVLEEDGLVVKAVGVVHGPVPALAYRVEYKGRRIVFSGDTSTETDNMIAVAKGADLLIYDTAIMDDVPEERVFFKLHTTPSRIGEVAAKTRPGRLVLSHITPVTDPRLDEVQRLIRAQGYKGKLNVAQDLDVYNLGQ
ncbi:MAG: MBL fold metallo-hydrolase [Gammaproteobacteria bacterium]|nr:MBL fold metallo-hydrolase [Gammaproteobacteria bacterium]NIR98481.1 MBL fold metallo-hydrolase [Gammaproteobacteria bacterium]NIT64225.1 MBL fold metallo-hydrolase [Gammaproteobacteria bacterium]NIV21169.1 MBL fold metallo-hydrolase [Gammaproteobacteria bacterium]NIX10737.1 MBL fold metallo-hydrolase [Gammaproteobacteria bacterium]